MQPPPTTPSQRPLTARRQQKLAELYRQACQALAAQNWLTARRLFEQLQCIQPGYRDTASLLEKARARTARPPAAARRPAPPAVRPAAKTGAAPRKRPPSLWWVGVLEVLAVLAGIILVGVVLFQLVNWLLYPPKIEDAQGVPMMLIPGGEFQMGSQAGASDEMPVHTVRLDAFYMDMYEVTNARYAACVREGGCQPPAHYFSYTHREYYGNPEYAGHPVLWISWAEAQNYCAWRGARLPTEAEWEKAARGRLEGKRYPWGDEEPVCTEKASNGANYLPCSESDALPVGSFAPNGYDLYDMAGNVGEWVADWYQPAYYGAYPPDGWPDNPPGPQAGNARLVRGGGWGTNADYLRVAIRSFGTAEFRDMGIGFRCVVSVDR